MPLSQGKAYYVEGFEANFMECGANFPRINVRIGPTIRASDSVDNE